MNLRRIVFTVSMVAVSLLGIQTTAAQIECGVIPNAICSNVLGNSSQQNQNAADVVRPLVEWIVNILIGIFALVAILIIVISGVQISASAGNEEVVKKGKENIFKVVTGLILLISFRAILSLVERAFVGVDTNSVFSGSGLNPSSIPLLITNVIGIAFVAAGAVSVVMIIVGGIQYIASGGGDGIAKAKKTITYAVAGLVISLTAYTIVTFVIEQLQ